MYCDKTVSRHYAYVYTADTVTGCCSRTTLVTGRRDGNFHHRVQIHRVENSLSPRSPNPSGRKFYYIVTKPTFFPIFILVGLLFVRFIIAVQRICLLEFQ